MGDLLKPLRTQTIGVKTYLEGRYWNTGEYAVAIMAVSTEGVDWAAYIGATPSIGHREEDTMTHVCQWGSKLSERDARHFFPNIKEPYRG